MITADLALWILTGLVVLLVVIVPLLDSTKKLSSIISFRWTCVAIILILMVAVVLDFNHLSDTSRDIILKGGLIVVGSFLAMRTIEKVLLKGYLKNVAFQGTVQKGDMQATISLTNNDPTPQNVQDLAKPEVETKEENNNNNEKEED